MIDGVIAVAELCDRDRHADLARELIDGVLLAGDADEVGIEVRDVPGQLRGRVALRIDRYQHNVRALRFRKVRKGFDDSGQHLQRRRTDVRAICEAEEDERPLAAQAFVVEAALVMVRQLEFGQGAGRIEERSRDERDGFVAGRTLEQRAREQHAGDDGYNADGDRCDGRCFTVHLHPLSLRNYRMSPVIPPVTVRELIEQGARAFEQAGLWFGHGTDNAFDEAAELVFFGAGLRHEDAPAVYDKPLEPEQRSRVEGLFERRIRERIPAAYLTHRMWFAGHEFYVDQRVLVPRSPIAELIEACFEPWIDAERIERVLDIGTGSGCIAVASALALPQAQVDATDVSEDALAVTAINVARYGLEGRVRALRSDVYDALGEERYDVIVSNPPYVGEEELAELPDEYAREPRLGLYGGSRDGLAIVERILHGAEAHLTPHGILIVEVGNSEEALIEKYPQVPFTWLEFERGGGGVFLLTAAQLRDLALAPRGSG